MKQRTPGARRSTRSPWHIELTWSPFDARWQLRRFNTEQRHIRGGIGKVQYSGERDADGIGLSADWRFNTPAFSFSVIVPLFFTINSVVPGFFSVGASKGGYQAKGISNSKSKYCNPLQSREPTSPFLPSTSPIKPPSPLYKATTKTFPLTPALNFSRPPATPSSPLPTTSTSSGNLYLPSSTNSPSPLIASGKWRT